MPKYNVTFTRDITESTTITVDATDPSNAEEQAYERATSGHPTSIKWEIDDCSCGLSAPYLADPNALVELAEVDFDAVVRTVVGII